MARPRKPTAVLEMQGTLRKDRHGNRMDVAGPPIPGDPGEPPALLQGFALETWVEVREAFRATRILTAIDRQALFTFCEMYGEWLAGVAGHGPRVTIPHINAMMALASRMGMDPVGRARLPAPPKEDAPEDPLTLLARKMAVARASGSSPGSAN